MSFYFKRLQLKYYIPKSWKFIIREKYENVTNFIICDHDLVKDSITLDKLTLTEIYSILISKAQKCLSLLFNINWTSIYMLPRLGRYNTYMQYFQYKISNNRQIWYLLLYYYNNRRGKNNNSKIKNGFVIILLLLCFPLPLPFS